MSQVGRMFSDSGSLGSGCDLWTKMQLNGISIFSKLTVLSFRSRRPVARVGTKPRIAVAGENQVDFPCQMSLARCFLG